MEQLQKEHPPVYKKVDTATIGEKISKRIHEFTPAGRMEKYTARFEDILEHTTGAERYLLMQKIDNDAKKYAWRSFTRDIVITVGSVGLVAWGGKRMIDAKGNVGEAARAMVGDVKRIGQYPEKAWTKVRGKANELGESFGKGAAEGVRSEVGNIASEANAVLEKSAGPIADIRAAATEFHGLSQDAKALTHLGLRMKGESGNGIDVEAGLRQVSETVAQFSDALTRTQHVLVEATKQGGIMDRADSLVSGVSTMAEKGLPLVDRAQDVAGTVSHILETSSPVLDQVHGVMDKAGGLVTNVSQVVDKAQPLADTALHISEKVSTMGGGNGISLEAIQSSLDSAQPLATTVLEILNTVPTTLEKGNAALTPTLDSARRLVEESRPLAQQLQDIIAHLPQGDGSGSSLKETLDAGIQLVQTAGPVAVDARKSLEAVAALQAAMAKEGSKPLDLASIGHTAEEIHQGLELLVQLATILPEKNTSLAAILKSFTQKKPRG